jgi:preprotein translocase subunit Sec61beta
VLDPALRLGAARRRGEERVQMLLRAGLVAALEEEEREPVMRA